VVHLGNLHYGHYTAFVKYHRKPVDISRFLQQEFIDRRALAEKHQFVEFAQRCCTSALGPPAEAPHYDDAPGTWYEINDDVVRQCVAGEEHRQKAYLLFYERVQ